MKMGLFGKCLLGDDRLLACPTCQCMALLDSRTHRNCLVTQRKCISKRPSFRKDNKTTWIVQINMNWLPNWPAAQFWALPVSTQTGICNVKTGASNLISKHHVLIFKKSLPKWWQFSSYSVDVYSWVNTKAEPHNLVNHPEGGRQPWWQSWKVWTHLHFGSQNNLTLFLLSKVGGITFY